MVLTHSIQRAENIYFWTTIPPSLCQQWRCEGYQTVGFVTSFLRETKSRLDPFFFSACVPFSELSGPCHMKTIAGTRWKTHEPTYANPSLSHRLQALSRTLPKLWCIAFKTPILTPRGFNPSSLLAATTARCQKFRGWGYWLMNASFTTFGLLTLTKLRHAPITHTIT